MTTTSTKRFISVLVALAVLVGALLQASPAAAQSDNGQAPYTVRAGDTLKKIADKYGLTVEQILAVNKSITDPNLIITGQVIMLPVGRSEGLSAEKARRIFVWQREKDGGRVEEEEHLYLVRSGDNFTKIAKAFGVSEKRLMEVNPQVEDFNLLFRGELIKIPEGRAEFTPKFYVTPHDISGEK